jgi:hypothetical protein
MEDIEKIIRSNASVFDDRELPEGHLARFEAKLTQAVPDESAPFMTACSADVHGKAVNRGHAARLYEYLAGAVAVAAAVMAVVIFINRQPQRNDWFSGVADDPVEVMLAYSEKASEICRDIFTKDIDGQMVAMVRSLEEAVPMIDQLPDEMDDVSKAAVLKRYYGDLLDGLDKLDKIKGL